MLNDKLSSENHLESTRREFLGSAALTAGGVAAGLSAYYLRPRRENLDIYDKEENQVRLGYIGVGNRGLALMRSSLQVPGNRPAAVCDARPSQITAATKDIRAAKGEDYKLATYDDYRRLLDDRSVEAVFIATPHYLHGPMAMDALDAGKHVYCEKAMCYSIGENRDLYRMVKSLKNRVFQVGHQRHYSPLYRTVKQMVEDDLIGNIVGMRAQWNKNDELRRTCPNPELEKVINWRLYSEYSGGLTTEFASHQIDVANWMAGTHPDSVCGYGGVDWFEDGRDTTDNIHLLFNYQVPIVERDRYGRVVRDEKTQKPVYKMQNGRISHRNLRFSYMSLMQNAHLGPSELILGEYGTLEVSLLGGEEFKETKERPDPDRKTPKPAVKAGSSVKLTEGGLPRKFGKIIQITRENKVPASHWVHFVSEIAGAYDREETLLAVGSYLDCVRKSRNSESFKDDLKADVEVGLWGAVPALMANIAMREERTVYWKEFFPEDVT